MQANCRAVSWRSRGRDRGQAGLAQATWLPAGNMLVRRDVFREVNGFDESLVTCEEVGPLERIVTASAGVI